MEVSLILYPVIAMAMLTFIIGLRMLQLRYRAVIQDNLNPHYFRLNRGGRPPDYMMQIEQHYTNLFESPVLFYVVVVLLYMVHFVDWISLSLAWGYVTARFGHAYIHTGANKVLLRRNIFLLSISLIAILWGYLFVRLLSL